MKLFLRIGLIGGLAVLSTWVLLEQRERLRLRLAIAQERQTAVELTHLRSANPTLAKAVERLAALCQAQRKLRDSAIAAETSAQADSTTDGYTAVEALQDRGTATVHDLFETYLWGLDHLDTATLARILYLPSDVKKKLAGFLADLPAEDRAQYASPEAAFAVIYASQVPPTYYSAVKVASPEPDPSDPKANFSKIDVNYEYSDGRVRTHTNWAAVSTKTGWKIFPTNANYVVDKFLTAK